VAKKSPPGQVFYSVLYAESKKTDGLVVQTGKGEFKLNPKRRKSPVTAVFTVLLAITMNGSSIGSTEDVIEADTADEAERETVEAWTRVRPECTFGPLLTIRQ
jgi:hypothetical protein